MDEVASLMPRMAIDMAAAAGLDVGALLVGLPFDRRSLATRPRVDWGDYCLICERLEALAGGPDGLYALMLTHYHEAMPPAGARLMRSVASPPLLYRTMYRTTRRAWARVLELEMTELADGRLRFAAQLLPGLRPCRAFFHGSVAAYAGVMGYLRMAPAEVTPLRVDGHGLDVLVRLPSSQTVLTWAWENAGAAATALRELLGLASGEPEEGPIVERADDADELELARHIDIVPLVDAIVTLVQRLGWARVALYVRPVDRLEVRLLSARGPDAEIEILRLSSPDGMLGLLELGAGPGDRARLDALLPRITTLLDAARTLDACRVLPDDPVIARLRPRERETLACLVRGLSEKEAAAALRLSPNTIHHYVKALYRAFRVRTRTELLARFITRGPRSL